MLAGPAQAGRNGTDRPFKGTAVGEATFVPNPLNCPVPPVGFGITTITTATGNASHMGKVSMHLRHCPLLDGSITNGHMMIVAANGDELHGTYTGSSTPLPPNIGDLIFATVNITFDPAASTGRFAGATGSSVAEAEVVFEGLDDFAWPWRVMWQGSVSY